ncbi:uncharacterized protein [Littorina saxatilis]|uniref:uncharacterized protein n=1 Tax=Littorina saxatilis TaxID=31220 RepID=UPI0038B60B7E
MTSDGAHDISVEIIPGHGPIFAGTIYTALVGPGKLTALNNTCPAYVAEGSDVRCQCGYLPTQQGSPPAHVSWVHGAMSAVLELDNVERQQHGNVYRCHSVWGAGEEINAYYNYTLQVAYGPTRNDITSAKLSDPDQNAILTCTSDYVFPSANFSWSITCLTETINRQSSACTVIPEVIMHNTEVVCVVSNFQLPDLHSTAVFKIGGTHDDENKDVTVVAVAGGVGCVALAAVAVVVIFAIVCKCRDKTYDKPRRRRQPSHVYLDLHHGTNTASAPSQQIVSGDLNDTALSSDADYLTPVRATVSASDAVPDYIEIMGEDPACEHSATYVNHPPAPDSEQDENHYYSQARDDVSTRKN